MAFFKLRDPRVMKIIWKSFILVSLTLASCLGAAHASQSSPAPVVVKPACRLEVEDAHISTTILKHRNMKVVKVNVYSVCNVIQSKVRITLSITKSQFPLDHSYGPFFNSASKQGDSGLRVSLQDKFVVCTNQEPTEWFGTAFAKAFIGGKWQYAGKTRSKNITNLKCGT